MHQVVTRSGIARMFRARFHQHLLVVGYHGVCSERSDVNDPAGLHVPVQLFEAQLRALLDHYQPVSLRQVFAHFNDGERLPDNSLLITFDDGYRNVLSNALPILRSLKAPCVFFPIVATVETGEWPWFTRLASHAGLDTDAYLKLSSELKRLSAEERNQWLASKGFDANGPGCDHSICSWNELAAALAGGSFEIGTHSMTHPALDNCGLVDLTYELVQARLLLEQRLNIDAFAVAYPFGRCSLQVCSAAAAAGYKLGFQVGSRHVGSKEEIMALPRIPVGPRDTPTILLSRVSGWMETISSRANTPT